MTKIAVLNFMLLIKISYLREIKMIGLQAEWIIARRETSPLSCASKASAYAYK
jgi:hypothetical protein